MGAGLHEWPLVFFTVLAQSAVGAFWAFSLVLLTQQGKNQANRIHYAMVALWIFMAVGFIFSTMHLGSPERAFNALNRIGASDLSNEIATGSAFFALGGGYWVLAVSRYLQKDLPNLPLVSLISNIENKLPSFWQGLGRIAVCVAGLIFIGAMAKLYMIPTVPTWNSPFTPINFFLTAVLSGSALAVALLQLAKAGEGLQKVFVGTAAIAFAVAIISTVLQYQYLAGVNTAIFKALDLVPDFISLMGVRFALIAVGLIALWLSLKNRQAWLSVSGFVLICFAELIARTLFYGLHMTVGLKAMGH